MDLCWENLAERMEAEVLDKYKVEERKKRPLKVEALPWIGGECAKNKKYTRCNKIFRVCQLLQ